MQHSVALGFVKFDLEHADLTYLEFLLTHNVNKGIREICSFPGNGCPGHSGAEISQGTRLNRQLLLPIRGWEFPMGQIGRAEFLIKAFCGVVHPIATPGELHCIAIVRDWATQQPLLVHSEVLLREDSLDTFLSLIGHVVPFARSIIIHSPPDSSRKRVSDSPLEGKGKRARSEPSGDDL